MLGKARKVVDNYKVWSLNRSVDRAKRDERISYPSYKSMDPFIDVERLKALDEILVRQIRETLPASDDPKFVSGPFKLSRQTATQSGSRMIELSRSVRKFDYFDLDDPDLWEQTDNVDRFPELMAFIDTLPFERRARMMIICDLEGRYVTAHRDHANIDVCHEFIWFRTNLVKPFFVFNNKTEEKAYIDSYAAWFDTVNQFHGADACGKMSVSIRVDGKFTEEFRAKIPRPACNPASTASLWACTEDR